MADLASTSYHCNFRAHEFEHVTLPPSFTSKIRLGRLHTRLQYPHGTATQGTLGFLGGGSV